MEAITQRAPRTLEVTIEGDARMSISNSAIAVLRREQARELEEKLEAVREAAYMLQPYDEGAARDRLEQLIATLKDATAAGEALWWLAPPREDDGDV